jgi:hypothetical protein
MHLISHDSIVEFAIRGWLHEKRGRTDSEHLCHNHDILRACHACVWVFDLVSS